MHNKEVKAKEQKKMCSILELKSTYLTHFTRVSFGGVGGGGQGVSIRTSPPPQRATNYVYACFTRTYM